MAEIGFQIRVGQGVVSGTDDNLNFAGSYFFPASGAGSAKVELAVWASQATDVDVTLEEGETFQIAGQTWRLDGIHDEGRGWYADLTRIA